MQPAPCPTQVRVIETAVAGPFETKHQSRSTLARQSAKVTAVKVSPVEEVQTGTVEEVAAPKKFDDQVARRRGERARGVGVSPGARLGNDLVGDRCHGLDLLHFD